MKDKILKEVLEWFKDQDNKDDVYIEDFVDLIIDKTTDALFEEIQDEFKVEFDKGNLKHPFIISSDYYLYLKLKEIKNKFIETSELDTSDEEIYTEKIEEEFNVNES